MKKWLIIFFVLFPLITLGAFFYTKKGIDSVFQNASQRQQAAILEAFEQTEETGGDLPPRGEVSSLITPIDEFYERITKKPFGIYITPQTSPAQPDRFIGYHTGVDVEYEGIIREIPVRAIAAGNVIFSKFASGYGGVIVLRQNINGEDLFVLYGHLDPKTMMPSRTEVDKGQIIGFLGEGKTKETDGARKHLHFAILKKNSLDIRGYVQNKKELEGWHDPMKFFTSF